MARGSSFKDVIHMTRAEARDSTNPGLTRGSQDLVESSIQGMYEFFWYDFSWRHLEVTRDIQVFAGQRYYNFPEDLDWDRVFDAKFKEGGRWRALSYGIGEEHYNQFDSDRDQRSWPPWRWDITEDTDDTEGNIDDRDLFEVWPIPLQNGDDPAGENPIEGIVRIAGIRNFRPIVDLDDRLELDDRLIALHVAAELLAAKESPLAQTKLARAQARYNRLKGGHSKRKVVSLTTKRLPDRGKIETRREGTYPYPT